ncbi:hypothetical protein CNEO_42724 [Clostridium neonatale]|uniref:Uncharacterized protein n=1 Tax=Clostridium neonatale TaxID=137838 RepID=A0AA86JLX9_9CLOT|nr:hypothetical protein CNEO_42724 [Clostridium neonatale]
MRKILKCTFSLCFKLIRLRERCALIRIFKLNEELIYIINIFKEVKNYV